MKKVFVKTMILFGLIAILNVPEANAQNEFKINGKADFVSDYIWRGIDQGSGFSVQPSMTLGYAGLSLNFWGSRSLVWECNKKEFDINLSYSIKNFSITLSDYWWTGVNAPYGDYKNAHYFEGTVAYNFGEKFPLTLSWSTMFAGADKNNEGKLRASTYINASYPVFLPADIILTPSIGFTPWKGYYYDKTAVTDISLKASKDIKVTEKFSIPLFIQAIVSPVFDRVHLVGGVSIGF